MRFTGQVKIPDLDYPGVPASVHVDGKQIELFVEGESLGRWSLVDVRAERLVSSAFSLKLAGEEVTFIADQPTEFAYGGVEEMANVWAKHKSMRLPLRVVANSRSRQGTKTSRIQDFREAIEETLAGNAPTPLDAARPTPPRKDAPGFASLSEATGRPVTDSEPEEAPQAPSPVEERVTEPEPVTRPAAEPSAGVADSGSDAREHRDPIPVSPDTPDVVFAEPDGEQEAEPPPSTDSIFKQSVPWAKSEESETDESETDDAPDPAATVPPASESAVREPEATEPLPPDEPDRPAEPYEPEQIPERAPAQSGSVPWLAPPVAEDPPAAVAVPASEPPAEEEREPEPVREPGPIVDLGELEVVDIGDGDRTGETMVAVSTVSVDDDDEGAASPQMAATAARGGIMGAVRSAFVRNRVEHTHEYVEAPGGLGIKRQICAECGHISIGVE